MDDKLLKKYREYASTEEAFAVLFMKKHVSQAKGHWVDIVDYQRYEMSWIIYISDLSLVVYTKENYERDIQQNQHTLLMVNLMSTVIT